MPRVDKSIIRSMFLDSLFLFTFFTMVGNLALHFWERRAVRNEINNIKQSILNLKVQSLQDTIQTIGSAYDQLHLDLRNVFEYVDETKSRQLDQCKAVNCKLANFYYKNQNDVTPKQNTARKIAGSTKNLFLNHLLIPAKRITETYYCNLKRKLREYDRGCDRNPFISWIRNVVQ